MDGLIVKSDLNLRRGLKGGCRWKGVRDVRIPRLPRLGERTGLATPREADCLFILGCSPASGISRSEACEPGPRTKAGKSKDVNLV